MAYHVESVYRTGYYDLDTQYHVNSAQYLKYGLDSIWSFLHSNSLSDALPSGVSPLVLKRNRVSFFHQQTAGVHLSVQSDLSLIGNKLNIDQRLVAADQPSALAGGGVEAVHIEYLFELPDSIIDRCLKWGQASTKVQEHWENEEVYSFTGGVEPAKLSYIPRHIDVDGFHRFPEYVIWRIFEEGRWDFFNLVGLTFDRLLENDLSFFWLIGEYRYYKQVEPGKKYMVNSWIDRIDKTRVYFRQDLVDLTDGTPVIETMGEFICVALSRSKPIRVHPLVIELFSGYIDKH